MSGRPSCSWLRSAWRSWSSVSSRRSGRPQRPRGGGRPARRRLGPGRRGGRRPPRPAAPGSAPARHRRPGGDHLSGVLRRHDPGPWEHSGHRPVGPEPWGSACSPARPSCSCSRFPRGRLGTSSSSHHGADRRSRRPRSWGCSSGRAGRTCPPSIVWTWSLLAVGMGLPAANQRYLQASGDRAPAPPVDGLRRRRGGRDRAGRRRPAPLRRLAAPGRAGGRGRARCSSRPASRSVPRGASLPGSTGCSCTRCRWPG